MEPSVAEIVDIIGHVLAIVRRVPQDLTWQARYSDERELVDDLTDHAGRIQRGDVSRMSDLRFLFVPTGPLCEIAVSSGWLHVYAMLGNRFDECCARL
ncbi:hypothetical protein AB0C34_03760 [Nocardia sp. NPDC049220]|uniref:hypothetical protein n=1 Tax=Nocardia sp. NPDC049220 TaxID=3155273 RepID=UPI0033DD9586